jgi:hypothetical protein
MLFPCSSCARHIRDNTCPFCGALDVRPSAEYVHTARSASNMNGLSRSALLAMAAATVIHCNIPPASMYGGPTPKSSGKPEADLSPPSAMYGAPPAPSPSGSAGFAMGEAYGAPAPPGPVATSSPSPSATNTQGALVPMYGMPPRVDSQPNSTKPEPVKPPPATIYGGPPASKK